MMIFDWTRSSIFNIFFASAPPVLFAWDDDEGAARVVHAGLLLQ
jgi:hypothetical protein